MKIKAIADRIFVRLEPEAEKTSGGVLLVSDRTENRRRRGKRRRAGERDKTGRQGVVSCF